uniref:Uncharacterized protein n=1 Tax=Plectus sambesii TaxID=2011161 RepID=A0A914V3Z3_9BILA
MEAHALLSTEPIFIANVRPATADSFVSMIRAMTQEIFVVIMANVFSMYQECARISDAIVTMVGVVLIAKIKFQHLRRRCRQGVRRCSARPRFLIHA